MPDNIEFDKDTGSLLVTGGNNFLHLILYFDNPDMKPFFGVSSFHSYKEGLAQIPTKSHFLQNKLTGLASCNYFGNSNTVFCGAFNRGGFLKCTGVEM